MKKIAITVFLAAALLACKKDAPTDKPDIPDPDPQPCNLTVIGNAATDATKTSHQEEGTHLSLSWIADQDKIGLYILADEAPHAVNLPYKADQSSTRTTFSAVQTAAQWKNEFAQHDFYAYYPYDENAGQSHSAVTVSVPAVQVQSAAGDMEHLSALDMLYAKKESTPATPDGSIELQFVHMFSVLELTLNADKGSVTTDRIIFRCQNQNEILATEGAKINLSTGKLDCSAAQNSNQIQVQLSTPVTLTPESEEKVYMQITPGHGGQKFDILAVVDGQEQLLGTKGIPASGIPSGVRARLAMSVHGQPLNLSENGTANTYIVDKADTEYRFDATVKGNGQPLNIDWNSDDWKNLNVSVAMSEADLTIAPVSAQLVWYNTPKSAEGWTAKSPVEIESVELKEDGYVYFKTPEQFVNGNALLAVYDAQGTILWSWNIWAVEDYNPDATAKTVGEFVMMDRNLGAMAGAEARTQTDPAQAALAIGNYYQWGRKDPFPAATEHGSGNLKWGLPTYTPIEALKKDCSSQPWGADNMIFTQSNTQNERALDSQIGSGFTIEAAVEESVKYPYKWITNGSGGGCTNPYMWMNSQGTDMSLTQQVSWRYLWGNMNCVDGVKTIYDPCPAGWMVPDAAAVGLALGKASLAPNGFGSYSAEYDLYFPFGGQRMAGFSGFSDIAGTDTEIFLATSTVSEKTAPFRGVRTTAQKGVAIDRYTDAAVTTGNSYAGQGTQMRCVKEQKVALSTKDLNGPRAGFLGNSITEVWEGRTKNPNFFKSNGYVHNGHSGTTTSNFVQRFNYLSMLNCRALVVCGGVNDIAENSGYYIPLQDVFNNLRMIAYWAEMAGMKVIMPSTVPANYIWWKDAAWNAEHTHVGQSVVELNKKIKALTEQRGYIYCDYWSSMADEQNGLKVEYSWTESDRVHPNGEGYAVMESLVKPCIDKALYDPDLIDGDGQLDDFGKVEL